MHPSQPYFAHIPTPGLGLHQMFWCHRFDLLFLSLTLTYRIILIHQCITTLRYAVYFSYLRIRYTLRSIFRIYFLQCIDGYIYLRYLCVILLYCHFCVIFKQVLFITHYFCWLHKTHITHYAVILHFSQYFYRDIWDFDNHGRIIFTPILRNFAFLYKYYSSAYRFHFDDTVLTQIVFVVIHFRHFWFCVNISLRYTVLTRIHFVATHFRHFFICTLRSIIVCCLLIVFQPYFEITSDYHHGRAN